ncbi:Conserved_hypothetical protein [Hexamita inflata]|uniref:Uncharacterized protein n=1 Tax=Hexamita inflata TaxID=28002 RepID=A0AA86UMB0_9EUKA|nr:Conserved hypothetical protein [Hexamita inflata]
MCPCDWFFSGRLWRPSFTCTLNSSVDLKIASNPATGVQSDLDASLITVVSLSSHFTNNSQFSQLLDVSENGNLKNAFIFVNATLNADSNVDSLFASVFGSFQGSMDNVTVQGFLNVTATQQQKIVLSTLIGSLGPQMDRKIYEAGSGKAMNNVSSGLRYFVNGIEVVQSGNVGGLDVQLVNVFDEPQLEIKRELADLNTFSNDQYKFVDSMNKEEFEIRIWSAIPFKTNGAIQPQYINAFEDLYPNALQIGLEKYYETKGMAKRYFDSELKELEMTTEDSSDVFITVYQEHTKAVAIRKNSAMVICEHPLIYDLETNKCIIASECINSNKLFFQSTCVSKCPDDFFVFQNECFIECPIWLGVVSPQSGSSCQVCSESQLASKAGCIDKSSCLKYVFNKGCFDFCPFGTVQKDRICEQPTKIEDCSERYPFLVFSAEADSTRFYNECSNIQPHWMYRIVDKNNQSTNVFKVKCSGTTLISGECVETFTQQSDSCPLLDQQTCRTACLNCFNNGINQNQCSNTCKDFNYQQPTLGTCHECLGDYDGGIFFDRSSKSCVKSCSLFSVQNKYLVCEQQCDYFVTHNSSSYKCVDSCQNLKIQHQFGIQCVDQCPVYTGFNGFCADKCEFLLGKQCETWGSENCPKYFIEMGQKICTLKCDGKYRFQVNGECVGKCPREYRVRIKKLS